MSGASANAAARRRRAAPNTMAQSQQKRNVPQSQNVKENMNNIITKDVQQSSIQSNPRTPVEMLKNVYQRMNKVEGLINEMKVGGDNQTSSNKRIDMMHDKIGEFEHKMSQIKDFERSITEIDEKVNKLVELCAKIQTFAMESNTSFLLFKNNFDAKLIQQVDHSDSGSGRGMRNELSVEDFEKEYDDENEVVELDDEDGILIDSEQLEMDVEMDVDENSVSNSEPEPEEQDVQEEQEEEMVVDTNDEEQITVEIDVVESDTQENSDEAIIEEV